MASRIIHWFRRDLRTHDNTALYQAAQDADEVVPVFFLDPKILQRDDIGAPITAFFLDSLRSLEKNLEAAGSRLILRTGNPLEEMPKLAREIGATAVYLNRDYEPHALVRDTAMKNLGEEHGFAVRTFKDLVIHEAPEFRTGTGTPYTVFTPYSHKWRSMEHAAPLPAFKGRGVSPELAALRSEAVPSLEALGFSLGEMTLPEGGERVAHQLLKSFCEKAAQRYQQLRDFPAVEGTSRLSPHLRAGTISVGTIYRAVAALTEGGEGAQKNRDVYLTELIWREFYMQILSDFPHVVERAFRPEYASIKWPGRLEHFEAWKAGRTGYPIVDAAIRQLNQTGWMHNRLRMVTAMFLTKDLLLNWQLGEQYFMQKLVDADCASNNGGWQWSASTGTDAAPYFRIFSPLSQSQKFDEKGEFIKKYVPELKSLGGDAIHDPWGKAPLEVSRLGYPKPIVEHGKQRDRAIALFKAIKSA